MSLLATIAPDLAPLLRLALGSDNVGEVFAASRAIRRKLAAAGLDHHDLADFIEASSAQPARPVHSDGVEDEDLRQWLRFIDRLAADGAATLKENDLNFLRNVRLRVALGRPPSEKQEVWLYSILDKIEARATA